MPPCSKPRQEGHAACTAPLQAHPRRVAKVASQLQREIGNMFVSDPVRPSMLCCGMLCCGMLCCDALCCDALWAAAEGSGRGPRHGAVDSRAGSQASALQHFDVMAGGGLSVVAGGATLTCSLYMYISVHLYGCDVELDRAAARLASMPVPRCPARLAWPGLACAARRSCRRQSAQSASWATTRCPRWRPSPTSTCPTTCRSSRCAQAPARCAPAAEAAAASPFPQWHASQRIAASATPAQARLSRRWRCVASPPRGRRRACWSERAEKWAAPSRACSVESQSQPSCGGLGWA